jgi:hypothetical protein
VQGVSDNSDTGQKTLKTMSFKAIKIFYWTTLGLSIVILPLNFGLGLIAIGLVILPILILHTAIGLNLSKLENYKNSLVFSGTNLLIFALIRPDGVHAFTDNGLSSILDLFGVYGGYNREYEDYFFFGSLSLLLIQAIADIRLRKLTRQTNNRG